MPAKKPALGVDAYPPVVLLGDVGIVGRGKVRKGPVRGSEKVRFPGP